MRDHEKYYYVEVALPKDNPAIQRMAAESERLDTPLSVLAKQACINAYSEDDGSEQPRASKPKRKKSARDNAVLEQSISSANDLLDEMGM